MPGPKKRTAAKAKPKTFPDNFSKAFSELREILVVHENDFHLAHDDATRYYLETKGTRYKGKAIMFAAVIMGRAYVSFHLFALYVKPEVVKTISDGLRKRMQGKSCFNFKAPDAELFRELEQLTKSGKEIFRERSWAK